MLAPLFLIDMEGFNSTQAALTVIETSDDKDDGLLCRLSTLLLISVIVKVFLSDLVEAFCIDAGARQFRH